MKVKCNCGAIYQVTAAFAGKKVRCKKCKSTFQVPGKARSVAPHAGKQRKSVAERRAEAEAAGKVQPKRQALKQTRPKTQAQLKAEHEERVLNKYIDPTRKTLEEGIAERRQDSIEKLRVTNGAKYIVIGVILFAVAIGAFILFRYLGDNGGYVPRFIAALYYSGAQWWLPILLFLAGIWHIFIGVGSIMKFVDIDEEEAFPEHF